MNDSKANEAAAEHPIDFQVGLDISKPIHALPDEYVTWHGKETGAPRPKIIWLNAKVSEGENER